MFLSFCKICHLARKIHGNSSGYLQDITPPGNIFYIQYLIIISKRFNLCATFGIQNYCQSCLLKAI